MEYADEPEVVFSPLSSQDYCSFYNLEMDSFVDDAPFYSGFLDEEAEVLEMGCGSGRLTRLLAKKCRHVTGVDISPEMLAHARLNESSNIIYHLGDMSEIKLSMEFDCIIIPYNSMNLLTSKHLTTKCLQNCRMHLKKSGKLLAQVYHPQRDLVQSAGKHQFQFTTLKQDNGDILIKETLKSYTPATETLILVERYRDRPFASLQPQRDLEQTLTLYAPQKKVWENILLHCGFRVEQCYGTYSREPFKDEDDTTLLIHASPLS